MVKQAQEAKTSSTRSGEYQISKGVVVPVAWLPETTNTTAHQDGPNVSFEISGKLRKGPAEERWSEPPHVAFANLHAEDARAVEAFVKRYGILHWDAVSQEPVQKESNVGTREDILRTRRLNQQRLKTKIENFGSPIENRLYSVESFGLFLDQDHLRGIWEDSELIGELETQVVVTIAIKEDAVELLPKDIWALICLLSVRDYKAGKLAVCENPDCPARYFVKKRKTQKFCEQGPCSAYAQRQYSLDWWNRVGKKRRDSKTKTPRKGSKS